MAKLGDRAVSADDEDIEAASVSWGDDAFFLKQTERGGDVKHCCLLRKTSAREVRDALNEFLEQ